MMKVPSLVIKKGSRARVEMVMALEMANKRKVMETSGGDQKGGAFSQGELTGTGTRMTLMMKAIGSIADDATSVVK